MTIDKIKEKYLSSLLSLSAIILNFKVRFSSNLDMSELCEKSIDISSISFGFLLAVLALLLQSDTEAIRRIKENGRFNELINFNKKAVISSALLAVFSLFYIVLNTQICNLGIDQIRLMIDCVILGVFVFQVVEVYLFLDLFYFIIK